MPSWGGPALNLIASESPVQDSPILLCTKRAVCPGMRRKIFLKLNWRILYFLLLLQFFPYCSTLRGVGGNTKNSFTREKEGGGDNSNGSTPLPRFEHYYILFLFFLKHFFFLHFAPIRDCCSVAKWILPKWKKRWLTPVSSEKKDKRQRNKKWEQFPAKDGDTIVKKYLIFTQEGEREMCIFTTFFCGNNHVWIRFIAFSSFLCVEAKLDLIWHEASPLVKQKPIKVPKKIQFRCNKPKVFWGNIFGRWPHSSWLNALFVTEQTPPKK